MTKIAVGFDPGKITGVAVANLNDDGNFASWQALEQLSHDQLVEWLQNFGDNGNHRLTDVVYEKFITYRQYAQRQIGSKQPASQAIGMIKYWAAQHKVSPIEQGADILQIAPKWSGIKTPSDHAKSHRFDAANHLYYYLVKNERAKSVLEMNDGVPR